MLRTFIDKQQYVFADHFDTWQEAVSASYLPLVKEHIVETPYIEAVIKCIETYGPYIIIAPNIAMPHSTEGATGVNDTAITFMKVEQPVHFDLENAEKDARLFFSLASTNHEQHLKNMSSLCEMLMQEDLIDDLLKATCEKDLLMIADRYNL